MRSRLDFDEPTDEILNGVPVRVPNVIGMDQWQARDELAEPGLPGLLLRLPGLLGHGGLGRCGRAEPGAPVR
ncbi:hypothetical protein [Demequina litorisediminis]|nr:hypothetical protein [Demequina litorisediminis]